MKTTNKESIVITKEELFRKAVKAMYNYLKAIEMDVPEFEKHCGSVSHELYQEIKRRGLVEEFKDYMLDFYD